MNNTIINKSKEKISSQILFLIFLFILSLFLIYSPEFFVSKFVSNSTFIFIVGILCFISSFLMIIGRFILLFGDKKGICITELGIEDYSNYESLGLIKWEDISGIKTIEIYSGNFLEIEIKNKRSYLQNLNYFQTILVYLCNWKPNKIVNLSTRTLDCNFNELESQVMEYYKKINLH